MRCDVSHVCGTRTAFKLESRMLNEQLIMTPTTPGPIIPKIQAKKIALPTEHGSWGFLFEPIVAGWAIAFSVGGVFISLMVIGGFLLRQPIKTYVIDRQGMRVAARSRAAMKFMAMFAGISALGLTGALLTVGWAPLLPFIIPSPLIIYQLYSDTQKRSRGLGPELSGAVMMSASIAAVVLAAGGSWSVAGALWAVVFARLFSSVLYVRERLLLEKGKPYQRTPAVAAHVTGVLLAGVLAYFRLVPALVLLPFVLLLYRCVAGLSPDRKPMKAMQIGVREVIFGGVLVVSMIIGYYTGV